MECVLIPFSSIPFPIRIHGAGILMRLHQGDFCWWDPWHTIHSSTMDPYGSVMGLGCVFFLGSMVFTLNLKEWMTTWLGLWKSSRCSDLVCWCLGTKTPFHWPPTVKSKKLQHVYIWLEIIYTYIIYVYKYFKQHQTTQLFCTRLVRVHCSFAAFETRRLVDPETTNPRISVLSRLEKSSICGWSKSNVCPVKLFFANIKPVNAVNQSLNPGRAPYKSMPSQLFQAQISGGRSWRLPIPSSMRFLSWFVMLSFQPVMFTLGSCNTWHFFVVQHVLVSFLGHFPSSQRPSGGGRAV